MLLATSGESRSRSRRLGNGRIGLSGNNDDADSGDIFSWTPRILLRDSISHKDLTAYIVTQVYMMIDRMVALDLNNTCKVLKMKQ
jgi:hypothetical protein